MGDSSSGYQAKAMKNLSERLIALHRTGVQVGVVIGGGNLFRGIQGSASLEIERSVTDQAGMLATVMNGLLLVQLIRHLGGKATLLSSIPCPTIADLYRHDIAMEGLQDSIVIFVGGTGHPYFTTDSAAALRACEIDADVLLKLTSVNGVYSCDPKLDPQARFYEKISYHDFITQQLKVLDLTAVTLCMNKGIAIRVCNLHGGSFMDALDGRYGSIIEEK